MHSFLGINSFNILQSKQIESGVCFFLSLIYSLIKRLPVYVGYVSQVKRGLSNQVLDMLSFVLVK